MWTLCALKEHSTLYPYYAEYPTFEQTNKNVDFRAGRRDHPAYTAVNGDLG